MKKVLPVILGLLLASSSFACDICGCSTGNYFIGPFPQFRKHFIGTRYTFRSYHSQVAGSEDEFSRDFYQTLELWGGYKLSKKWQVMAFVPYNINRQTSDDGTRTSNGLGDITLLANYKLLDKQSKDKHNNKISQLLLLGAGTKLPTGKFAADQEEIVPDANNQPGTGSVDLVLNGMYALHINEWGINTNANYRVNNAAHDFRFGNRFSSSVFGFRTFNCSGTTSISPNAGVLYEHLGSNKLAKETVEDTGGHALLAAAGAELSVKSITVGLNAQLPIAQNLSNHQTENKVRGMVHVTLSF